MVFFTFCYCKECCSENWCTNVWVPIFNIFECLSRDGIAWSSVNSMCNFWRNCQTLFHSYVSILHFHKGSSFSSTLVIIYLFFIIAILVSHSHAVSDVKWYLIVSFCFVCGECVCVCMCLRFIFGCLGLCCCARALSSCCKWELLFVLVFRLLSAVISLFAEHGL